MPRHRGRRRAGVGRTDRCLTSVRSTELLRLPLGRRSSAKSGSWIGCLKLDVRRAARQVAWPNATKLRGSLSVDALMACAVARRGPVQFPWASQIRMVVTVGRGETIDGLMLLLGSIGRVFQLFDMFYQAEQNDLLVPSGISGSERLRLCGFFPLFDRLTILGCE